MYFFKIISHLNKIFKMEEERKQANKKNKNV